MITFKQFLTEAEVKPHMYKPMSVDELRSVLENQASDAWRITTSGGPLFRGFSNISQSGLADPSTGERKSENVNNQYTSLMASNPANADWPKRSKSFICTTDQWTADAFGEPFYVVPYNGTKYAHVTADDLHLAGGAVRVPGTKIDFRLGYGYLPGFLELFNLPEDASWSDFVGLIQRLPNMEVDPIREKFFESIIFRGLRKQDDFLMTADDEEFMMFVGDLLDCAKDMLTFSKSMNSAGKPNFKLVDSLARVEEDVEVWFSGPCVLLTFEDYATLTKSE